MPLKILVGKVGVALHNIDNDRSPGIDVARLSLVQLIKATDDVGAKPTDVIRVDFY